MGNINARQIWLEGRGWEYPTLAELLGEVEVSTKNSLPNLSDIDNRLVWSTSSSGSFTLHMAWDIARTRWGEDSLLAEVWGQTFPPNGAFFTREASRRNCISVTLLGSGALL